MSAGLETLERLGAVNLDELDAKVPMRIREDRKHVIDLPTLQELLAALGPTHVALEIDGRRAFTYDSVYFDTPDLLTARAHVQRRRRRFKCRTRVYRESGTCALEVKLKGSRGETVKHRLPYAVEDHGALTEGGRAFLSEHLDVVPELAAVLRTVYTRSTLVGPGERVTIDRELSFGAARLNPGWAIVETKSARGAGVADRALRRLGSRPVSLSKYVVGAGLTQMASPPNDSRHITRRYFSHA